MSVMQQNVMIDVVYILLVKLAYREKNIWKTIILVNFLHRVCAFCRKCGVSPKTLSN